jgi:MFS family permease
MNQAEVLTRKGLLVWSLTALFFLYEFLLRTSVGTFEQSIVNELSLSLISFALISSTAYNLVYGLMQIPAGIITDRFGLKLTLTIAAAFCGLSVLGFSRSNSFESAIILRVLTGLGSSFGFICLLVAVYEWLPRKNLALYIGLSQLIGTMGPMLAAGPLNSIAESGSLSWRTTFFVLGFFGLSLTFFIWLFVKNNKEYTGNFQILKRAQPLRESLAAILTQKQLWLVAIYSGSVYFTIEYLSENSGKTFLMLNGHSSSLSSYLLTISWIGYSIGCPLFGFVSDCMSRRKPTMIFAACVCLLSIIFITYLTTIKPIMFVAFFMLGLGASGQSIGFAIVSEHCRDDYMAAGLGFNNAIIAIFTSINAPLIGFLINLLSHGHTPGILAYQKAFSLILIFLTIAIICSAFFIKETFCKSRKEPLKLKIN